MIVDGAYDRVCHFIRVTCGLPFQTRQKSESWLMRAIGAVLYFFNPAFMVYYTTTIGSTIYFPDGYVAEHPNEAARTLAHEGIHLRQAKRVGRLRFSLAYLFPQVLALLSLGAAAAFWWAPAILFLGFLVFLAPWPAPWRVRYEREAYFVSIVCDIVNGWNVKDSGYVDYMVGHYCGWGYYKPAWRRSKIREMVRHDIDLAISLLSAGTIPGTYTHGIVNALKDHDA